MELVLDVSALGVAESERNGRNSRTVEPGGLPRLVRLVLALGAVAAAWLLMTDPQIAEFASRIVGDAGLGAVPGPIGTVLASLPLA
ncbi:MAG TPA: hypothetical protein VHA70_01425 [Bauldia sp.]|nr:hypothetical protein [Bauldia sp.]